MLINKIKYYCRDIIRRGPTFDRKLNKSIVIFTNQIKNKTKQFYTVKTINLSHFETSRKKMSSTGFLPYNFNAKLIIYYVFDENIKSVFGY